LVMDDSPPKAKSRQASWVGHCLVSRLRSSGEGCVA
jgi:hypothetical protein